MLSEQPDRKMSEWSIRLLELIKESDYPEADMREAAYLMEESRILHEEPFQVSPEKFAQLVIDENPLMQARMAFMRSIPNLKAMETAADLISHLLPANNSLD